MRGQRFHGVKFVTNSPVEGLDASVIENIELSGGDLGALSYANRADLRTTAGQVGQTLLVQRLGLFSLHSGDGDIDDGETCFINDEGNRWLLETTHHDLVESLIEDAILASGGETTLTADALRAVAPWLWEVTVKPTVSVVYEGYPVTEEVSAAGFKAGDKLDVFTTPTLPVGEGFNIEATVINDGVITITYTNGTDGTASFNPLNYTLTVKERKI